MFYFWIILGGAIGTLARYGLNNFVTAHLGGHFPWGTLVINITGSFAIGFFATLTGPDGKYVVGPGGKLFFMTGICGGYTTFSAFSLQTLELARGGEWLRVGSYVVSSVVLALFAVWLGHVAALAVNASKGA